jgi:hypothetical protein
VKHRLRRQYLTRGASPATSSARNALRLPTALPEPLPSSDQDPTCRQDCRIPRTTKPVLRRFLTTAITQSQHYRWLRSQVVRLLLLSDPAARAVAWPTHCFRSITSVGGDATGGFELRADSRSRRISRSTTARQRGSRHDNRLELANGVWAVASRTGARPQRAGFPPGVGEGSVPFRGCKACSGGGFEICE